MRKIFFFSAITFSTFMLSCGNDKSQGGGDTLKASGDAGASLYSANCTMCHGADGKAGAMGAADLSVSKLDHAGILAVLKNGRNNMKSYADKLDDAQMELVAKYVEGLRH